MPVIKSLKSIIRKNSAGSDFMRRRINLIEGANITLTVADDPTNNEVDVTIVAAGGGGGGLTWNEVAGTTQAAAVDNGYIANNVALVTVTIPDTAAFGSVVRVAGNGAGGWAVAQNAGETIHFGNVDSTTGAGGSLASTNRYDAVELVCITANTDWAVISSLGNITIV